MAPPKPRLSNLDAFRVFGFVAVVILHSIEDMSGEVTVGTLFRQLFRWAVPSFFIVSGYLQGISHKSDADKITSTIIRILPLLVGWVIFYDLFKPGIALTGPKGFALSLISGGTGSHLWFLFALLVTVPFVLLLSRFGLTALLIVGGVLFLVAMAFEPYRAVLGLPKLPWFWGIEFKTRWGPLIGTLFVGIGYILAKSAYRPSYKLCWILIGSGVALQYAELMFINQVVGQIRPFDCLFGTIPLSVGVSGMFLTLKPSGFIEMIAKLGPCTLGAYCIHIAIIWTLFPVRPNDLGVKSLVIVAVVSALALGISFVGSKVPILRRAFI